MIVDQHRAANDPARTSSGQHLAMLTRKEWQFLQSFRQCSPADQVLIFRTVAREAMRARSPEAKP